MYPPDTHCLPTLSTAIPALVTFPWWYPLLPDPLILLSHSSLSFTQELSASYKKPGDSGATFPARGLHTAHCLGLHSVLNSACFLLCSQATICHSPSPDTSTFFFTLLTTNCLLRIYLLSICLLQLQRCRGTKLVCLLFGQSLEQPGTWQPRLLNRWGRAVVGSSSPYS